ncbi:MAG: L-aspartate oxidase [Planctomycetes bacterium]|nr:L-aspartate oxidase [Planctomycetota bacterium]
MASRRHLTGIDTFQVPHRFTDVLVIGAGLAGCRAAIAAASVAGTRVIVIAKGTLEDANSEHAQGGIAAVLDRSAGDSPELHIEDTLRTGCGLSDPRIVEIVVREGIDRVRELIDWGTRFDRREGKFRLAQEGGHSRPRILHAQGDYTGHELLRTLLDRLRGEPQIHVIEHCFSIDLLTEDGRCVGAMAYEEGSGVEAIWARAVIIATGGGGRLFRETTNPPNATADGVAMAYRAGAPIRDMEFVQFHPTALYVAGADRFLITEAARGEGGKLRDRNGRAFMKDYHPNAELAPRDVVSRAILAQLAKVQDSRVFLDLTGLDPDFVRRRFPNVDQICRSFGIDITKDPIPVRPSAHYMVGGICVDAAGTTEIEGLYACGEAASTGLHGANRLGSNSLLEALVFGTRAGIAAGTKALSLPEIRVPTHRTIGERRRETSLDLPDLVHSLQSLMGRLVGIERAGPGLDEAVRQIEHWTRYALDVDFLRPDGWTLQNLLTAAGLVARAALARCESRGVHYRTDFPATDDETWRAHMEWTNRRLDPTIRPAP